jgi:hypothetical protein
MFLMLMAGCVTPSLDDSTQPLSTDSPSTHFVGTGSLAFTFKVTGPDASIEALATLENATRFPENALMLLLTRADGISGNQAVSAIASDERRFEVDVAGENRKVSIDDRTARDGEVGKLYAKDWQRELWNVTFLLVVGAGSNAGSTTYDMWVNGSDVEITSAATHGSMWIASPHSWSRDTAVVARHTAVVGFEAISNARIEWSTHNATVAWHNRPAYSAPAFHEDTTISNGDESWRVTHTGEGGQRVSSHPNGDMRPDGAIIISRSLDWDLTIHSRVRTDARSHSLLIADVAIPDSFPLNETILW